MARRRYAGFLAEGAAQEGPRLWAGVEGQVLLGERRWVVSGCYLSTFCTALNSGAAAVRTHSRQAVSTVVGTAPDAIIFSHPMR